MYPQPYPTPPRRGVPGPIVVFVALGCLLFGIMFGFGVGVISADPAPARGEQAGAEPVAADTPSGRRSSPTAEKPTKTAKPKPTPEDSFGDGTHRVGKDIRPGTYRTKGGDGCYWARLRDFKGELDSIIANGNPTGAAVVTIRSGDEGFESSNCREWKRIG